MFDLGGLVVPGGVEGELADEGAGGGVGDPDVQVLDEHEDAGSGVGSAYADVVEAAGVAQGDDAGGIDGVAADAAVFGGGAGGGGFGSGLVGGVWGAAGQGSVGSGGVVVDDELVEQGL